MWGRSGNRPLYYDGFQGNSMYCPSCNGTIKYFSKLNFKFNRVKTCPYCSVKIRHSVNMKYFSIGFIPTIVIHLYFLGPILFSLGVPYANNVAQFITLFVFNSIIQQFKLAEKT